MRILIATGIFKPEVGGPATLAAELAKRFTNHAHTVSVMTYSSKPSFDFDKEFSFKLVRITRTGSKLKNYFRYFLVAFREVKNHDVVYSLDWFSGGLPLMIACKLRGKKYSVRVGGGYIWEKYLAEGKTPISLRGFYNRGLQKDYKLMFWIIKRVLQQATYVVFNSDIQREIYIKEYTLSPEKTLTIQNAVPENRLSTLVQNYNDKYTEHDKEIVFAGRFIKMKNVESLVKAFVLFKDTSYKLILIGEGPEEKNLKDLVGTLGLHQRVTFLGTVSQSDLYRRIAHCFAVVIPSWTDVSPNQAYECLALGIPFLITKENYLSIAEQLPMMVNPASVDDIAEKLNALLDPEQYKLLTQTLRNITFHHPWEFVVEEHFRLFKKIA